jgi:hypothetical protein
MSILNYLFIGAAFTFILDLILTKLNNHPLMKEIIKKWGYKERIACTIIWPLATLIFVVAFTKSIFK